MKLNYREPRSFIGLFGLTRLKGMRSTRRSSLRCFGSSTAAKRTNVRSAARRVFGTLARSTEPKTALTDSKKVTAQIMTPAEVAANPKAAAVNALRPVIQAAQTIGAWGKTSMFQLDIIFNTLCRRAVANFNEGQGVVGELTLRMSLRAQSQCRATLEALALLKNPPAVTFVRQANVASGYQQVNNAVSPEGDRHARETRQENYWSRRPMNGWTVERRKRQAELIRSWKPWQQSMGPRSAEGKGRVSRNAYKGAIRPSLRVLARALRAQRRGISFYA